MTTRRRRNPLDDRTRDWLIGLLGARPWTPAKVEELARWLARLPGMRPGIRQARAWIREAIEIEAQAGAARPDLPGASAYSRTTAPRDPFAAPRSKVLSSIPCYHCGERELHAAGCPWNTYQQERRPNPYTGGGGTGWYDAEAVPMGYRGPLTRALVDAAPKAKAARSGYLGALLVLDMMRQPPAYDRPPDVAKVQAQIHAAARELRGE